MAGREDEAQEIIIRGAGDLRFEIRVLSIASKLDLVRELPRLSLGNLGAAKSIDSPYVWR